MPSGPCALKLAKAITLPLPAQSRHTNSQALTLKRTRGGGVGGELKPGRAFIWHSAGQAPRCPGLRLAQALDQQPRRIPNNRVPPPDPRPRDSGEEIPDPHIRPRQLGGPDCSFRGGAAWITARPSKGRPQMRGGA